MGSFRQGRPGFGGGNRGGGFNRGGNRGGFSRGGDRGGDRDFGGGRRFGGGDRDRRGPAQMYDAVCSKCGKQCQVPFKPTGSKPVLCSDCFRKNDNFSHGNGGAGVSQEQINQINAKLDKIIKRLDELEITEDEDLGDEEEFEDADEEKEEGN